MNKIRGQISIPITLAISSLLSIVGGTTYVLSRFSVIETRISTQETKQTYNDINLKEINENLRTLNGQMAAMLGAFKIKYDGKITNLDY